MSEPFIAEIRLFAGNFAPRGWSFCTGQLLPISQNTALFSLIGTTYGGDGRTTVGLPNLSGRLAMHPGRGPGLSPRTLGERGGVETVQLSEDQIPNHTHAFNANSGTGRVTAPEGASLAKPRGGAAQAYANADANMTALSSTSLDEVGGSTAHTNMQPFLALNFIIALVGLFPSRS